MRTLPSHPHAPSSLPTPGRPSVCIALWRRAEQAGWVLWAVVKGQGRRGKNKRLPSLPPKPTWLGSLGTPLSTPGEHTGPSLPCTVSRRCMQPSTWVRWAVERSNRTFPTASPRTTHHPPLGCFSTEPRPSTGAPPGRHERPTAAMRRHTAGLGGGVWQGNAGMTALQGKWLIFGRRHWPLIRPARGAPVLHRGGHPEVRRSRAVSKSRPDRAGGIPWAIVPRNGPTCRRYCASVGPS